MYARYNLQIVIALIVLLAATVAASPKVETFPVPKGHLPTEIARQGDSMVFVSWTNWPALEPHLGTVTTKGRVQTHPLEKDHMPGMFAAAADGSLWLTDVRRNVLWHVGPDGTAEQVEIDRPTLGIAIDATGQVWCTHTDDTEISRYNPGGAKSAELDTGRGRFKLTPAKPQKAPAGMAPTWARESQRANRTDVTPTWIVAAGDILWFSDPTKRSIGAVSADGHQERFKLPPNWGAAPGALVAAPDGLIWFVVAGKPFLGQVSREGFFSNIDLPAPAQAIAIDAKGRVWFSTASTLGYVERDGTLHSVPLPKPERTIRSMAAGSDGAMWFVDQKTKTIGRVTLP